MPKNLNNLILDSNLQLAGPNQEKLAQDRNRKQKAERGYKRDNKDSEEGSTQSQLRRGRQEAINRAIQAEELAGGKKEEGVIKSARKKMSHGADAVFFILLMIAIVLDVLSFFDLGTASWIVNIFACVIGLCFYVFIYFFSATKDRLDVVNLLRGKMMNKAIMVSFECFPFSSVLPIWTGVVLTLWIQVRNSYRGIIREEEEREEEEQRERKAKAERIRQLRELQV